MIPNNITKEHLEKAIQEIDEQGIRKGRQSSTYDLVYDGKHYPPKLVVSIANCFANGLELDHSTFSGGIGTPAFNLLTKEGFEIIPKQNTIALNLDQVLFRSLFREYIEYCKRSVWLSDREAYKFRFGRWLNERIDFSSQSDEDILKICLDSQAQNYRNDNEVGINFVLSAKRFSDNFISIENIKTLRKLHNEEVIEETELSSSSMSFPKLSVWAGSMIPERFRIYANEELQKGLAHLFNLNDYPKSGIKAFDLANDCLNKLSFAINDQFESQVKGIIGYIFPGDIEVREVDKAWLTQDFILYLIRRKLNPVVNYYWVNQGKHYQVEKKHECISAANGTTSHHKILKDLNEGDILVHYSDKRIMATSIVVKEYEVKPRPMAPENDKSLVVGLQYRELGDPLPFEEFQPLFMANPEILPKTHSPFDRNFKMVQSYCLQFNEASFKLLFSKNNYNSKEPLIPTLMESVSKKLKKIKAESLNQILYGPPGTGKTYSTIEKALEIVHGPDYLLGKNRTDLQIEFNSLKEKGQIQFTTFHQSFSYEDFVEGIRPIPPGKGDNETDQLIYDVESGIFKSLCESANGSAVKTNSEVPINLSKSKFFKMSLGGRQKQELHDWCIENGYVALGYGGNHDYSELKENKDWNSFKKYFNTNYPELVEKSRFNIQAVYAFLGMKKGDIVLATLGNHIVDAIGVVDGDYEWSDDKAIDYSQFRKVKWLATNLKAKPEKFVRKKISQQTIYEFYDADIKKEAFENLLSKESDEEQNYVLIIDEINRGNVASIFGELITLLEPDKRLGAENELTLTLPYSRDTFGVPSNLHIIGTMNTADRSVEALDTALRRRFSFTEMMCNYDVLDKILGVDFRVEGIVVKTMLKTINHRLELLLNRDHQIGHAWFLSLKNAEDKKNELDNIFKNKIIPLLQEFFYADYGKIGLVLGNGFVEVQIAKNGNKPFANFEYENEVFEEQNLYKIRKKIDWELVSKEFGKKKTSEQEEQESSREKEAENVQ